MTRARFAILIAAGAAICACALLLLASRTQVQRLEVPFAQLQVALEQELRDDGEVGFLPRARFDDLKVGSVNGLVIAGTGQWFSVGAGAFTLPEVSLIAEVPTGPGDWTVETGQIQLSKVVVQRAYREPHGQTKGRDESAANRAGWAKSLTTLLNRLPVFEADFLTKGDWQVVEVAHLPDRLIFGLEN